MFPELEQAQKQKWAFLKALGSTQPSRISSSDESVAVCWCAGTEESQRALEWIHWADEAITDPGADKPIDPV